MYQLYAYGTKYISPKCENMYLIYPKNESELTEHQYHYQKDMGGLKLKVLFFDLENPDENEFYDYFAK